jgi:two-component system cell cycle sensor histidine kinase/response regulator CckA
MAPHGRAEPDTILVASAEPTERAELARLFAEAGFRVTEATAADEAVRRAIADNPGLVLLGHSLADPDRAAVCRGLAGDPNAAGIPVLLLCPAEAPHGASGQLVLVAPVSGVVACARNLIRLCQAEERAREALRESEERYRTLFERNPHPLFVYDRDTLAYLAVNDAAVHHYGYSRDEFLRMTIMDIRPSEDVPRLQQILANATDEFEHRGVWRHRRKDGSLIDVEIFVHALQFGDRPACIVLAYDVSDRRRLEEQFLQSQKMEAVGRLAGGVAHDFNNLLTVINGYADMLLEDLGADAPPAAHARAIRNAGERAATLTQQLLAFGRKQIVAARLLDFNAVVAETARLLSRLIGEDILVSLELAPNLGGVRADPNQLQQVILNLAVNARDAMPQGGQLTITTREVKPEETPAAMRDGPAVVLALTDSGHGMTEEVRRHLFEPFFTTKPVGKGTGLGLATVYGIIKQAGGHIEVESNPGAGTTFRIYLPRAADAGAATEPAAPPPRTGRQTVLLAEDEDAVRALAREVLQTAGYVVLEARDGAEALNIAERHGEHIDLLISDVIMPGMGGRQLAERLLDRDANLKVLYLSGYVEDAVVRQGVSRDEVHFLPKPFSPAVLADKVREVLAAAR